MLCVLCGYIGTITGQHKHAGSGRTSMWPGGGLGVKI